MSEDVAVQDLTVSKTSESLREDIFGIKSIIEKPALLEIAFLPQPSFAVENMLKLRELLGSAMKLLPPPQQLLRIRLSVLHKKDITGFTGRVLMQLAGDEKALQQAQQAAHAKKRLQA